MTAYKKRFAPHISHSLTLWRGSKYKCPALEFWRGDDAWPKSVQLTFRWRGVVYWHIWFYGLWRNV